MLKYREKIPESVVFLGKESIMNLYLVSCTKMKNGRGKIRKNT